MALTFVAASTQYIVLSSAVLTAHPVSMSCWFKPASLGGGAKVLQAVSSTTAFNTFGNQVNNNNNLYAAITQAGSGSTSISVAAVTIGNWFHCVSVFSSTTSRLCYLNNVASTAQTTSRLPVAASINRTSIGAYFNTSTNATLFINGSIAYPTIWNYALDSTDVGNLYNGGAGCDPRTVQGANIVSFFFLDPGTPYLDTATGTTWSTSVSPPTQSADPFTFPNRPTISLSDSSASVSIETCRSIPVGSSVDISSLVGVSFPTPDYRPAPSGLSESFSSASPQLFLRVSCPSSVLSSSSANELLYALTKPTCSSYCVSNASITLIDTLGNYNATSSSLVVFTGSSNITAAQRFQINPFASVFSLLTVEAVPSHVTSFSRSCSSSHIRLECFYPFTALSYSECLSAIRVSDPNIPNLSFYSKSCAFGKVSLGTSDYAILSYDGLSVDTVMHMSPEFILNLLIANPSLVFLPVNMSIAQPYFDPLIETIVQNGWLITDVDVQPIWKIKEQTPDEVADTLVLASSDFQTCLSTWGALSPTDKDDLLKRLTEVDLLILNRYREALIM